MEQQEMQEERRARNFCLGSGGTVWAGTAVSRLCTGWDGGYVSEYYYRSQL